MEQVDSAWSGTPLFPAVQNDHFQAAALLLEAGADPNAQEPVSQGRDSIYGGDTPLHEAVYLGSTKLVKLLLTYGANPDIQNARRASPLEVANQRGNTHLVRLMEAHFEGKPCPRSGTMVP